MPAVSSELPATMHHVFVDFENVHQIDDSVIGQHSVRFTLLVGAKHTKLDLAIVERLLAHAESVQLVRLTASGRNALDFALAYFLGQAVLAGPAGHFHIVSKDKGYDPLLKHLESRNVKVQRHDDYTTLPFLTGAKPAENPLARPASKAAVKPATKAAAKPAAKAAAKPAAKAAVKPVTKVAVKPAATTVATDPFSRIKEHLRTHPENRPKKMPTLKAYLRNALGKTATEAEDEVLKLVEQLCQKKVLSVDDKEKVTWQFGE